jgi:predicted enzyme related to lactoylglutathione lyase
MPHGHHPAYQPHPGAGPAHRRTHVRAGRRHLRRCEPLLHWRASTVEAMALRWYSVVIDCHDIAAQARWWAAALDWQITYEADDEVCIMPPHAASQEGTPWGQRFPEWCFVQVPEGKTVKNRLHLDLAPHTSQDRDAEIERLLQLGARRVDVGQDESDDAVTWTVLADPEGNEFCVLSARDR